MLVCARQWCGLLQTGVVGGLCQLEEGGSLQARGRAGGNGVGFSRVKPTAGRGFRREAGDGWCVLINGVEARVIAGDAGGGWGGNSKFSLLREAGGKKKKTGLLL
jgi:hypothetical protein